MFKLCAEADLEDDVPIECDGPDGALIVVVRHNGEVFAVAGECPHQAAPMADAEVADGKITCCLHFWSWHLKNGQPFEEAEEPLPVYALRLENGDVFLADESGEAAGA